MNKTFIPTINLSEYEFELPKERIALYPHERRDLSKLLFTKIGTGIIEHYEFRHIVNLIPPDSVVILNDTKVISARLQFKKQTGGKVELLLIQPVHPSAAPAIALSAKYSCVWECFVGGRNIREGMVILSENTNLNFTAKILQRYDNSAMVEFVWLEDISFGEVIELVGSTPLPPYIDRESEKSDIERYQTVYARFEGSVAAPTAGLHFTESIIKALQSKGIFMDYLTLHVGPGTFVPIVNDEVATHQMHEEQISVTYSLVRKLLDALQNKRRIIAVGTTCIRTLESIYWHALGVKNKSKKVSDFNIEQWEPYQTDVIESPEFLLELLAESMDNENIDRLVGKTKLLIVPGYDFKLVNGLITNFHLPKSTLILLVAAFTGKDTWREIYNYALKNDFRFLSYGDSTFLLK